MTERGLRVGETILGLAILALGLFIAIQTWMMPAIAVTAAVGPRLFPAIVASGLIAISGFILHEAIAGSLKGRRGLELDWRAVAIVLVALLAQFALLGFLGWILTTAILFVAVAHAFGNRTYFKSAIIGLVLGAITFGVFDYALDLNLPTGSLFDYVWDQVHPTR